MGIIDSDPPQQRRVGLIFDERMCKHSNSDDDDHPENPNRIRAIWNKLNASGLVHRCVVLNAKEAEDNQLALVHSKEHIDLIKTISSTDFITMRLSAEEFDSIYFNEGSSEAAYLAAGSVIEAAEKVAKGELDSAFAIVRPPGHHAEDAKPMGFCLYNNVAIATSFLLNERPELGIRKILIVDWDVHHGNSTQKVFYKDPRVLFFSVHRHDFGSFYPYGNDGSYTMTGEGPGAGYNINVPWENGLRGDADYLAVWDHILIPVAKEFDPDMIIISAGFDAGDPVGGCLLSSNGYSIMLDKLMDLASGKIVMALEGGYNPVLLANSAQACIEVLLQDKPLNRSLEDLPLESTWRVIKAVRQALCLYWPVLAAKVPDKVISSSTSSKIEVDIGVKHVIQDEENAHTTSLQVKSEVEQVHAADEFFSLEGRKSDLLSVLGRKNVVQEHTSAGLRDTSPCHGIGKGLFSDGVNALEGFESFSDTTETVLGWWNKVHPKIRSMVSEDDLKPLCYQVSKYSDEQLFAGLIQSISNMGTVAMMLDERAIQRREEVTRLEAAEEMSNAEISQLKRERDEAVKDRDAWKDRFEREVLTGKKFLESKAGKAYMASVKEDGVSEFKASSSFDDIVLDRTISILHGQTTRSGRPTRGD